MTTYYTWCTRRRRSGSWMHSSFESEYPFECPVQFCIERFRRPSDLVKHQHSVRHFNHFRYAVDVHRDDMTCEHCAYVPNHLVDNPKACLRRHMLRKHVMYAKPYTIKEFP